MKENDNISENNSMTLSNTDENNKKNKRDANPTRNKHQKANNKNNIAPKHS